MATTNPTSESVSASNHLARDPTLPRHQSLGVDGEGFIHHLDRSTGHVHRIKHGVRERVCDLTLLDSQLGAAIEQYVHGYVGAEVGWLDRTLTTRDLFGTR